MNKSFESEMELQFARWNHNFTLISIIHGAFLGAVLSKIDYVQSLWTMLFVFVGSLVLTGSLYEIHGIGLTRIRNAVSEKLGLPDRYLHSILILQAAPMAVFFASEESSIFYAFLAAIIVMSWFTAAVIVSIFLSSEIRKSVKDASG